MGRREMCYFLTVFLSATKYLFKPSHVFLYWISVLRHTVLNSEVSFTRKVWAHANYVRVIENFAALQKLVRYLFLTSRALGTKQPSSTSSRSFGSKLVDVGRIPICASQTLKKIEPSNVEHWKLPEIGKATLNFQPVVRRPSDFLSPIESGLPKAIVWIDFQIDDVLNRSFRGMIGSQEFDDIVEQCRNLPETEFCDAFYFSKWLCVKLV